MIDKKNTFQTAYFYAWSVFFVLLFVLRVFEFTEPAKYFIPLYVLGVALYSWFKAEDRSMKGTLLLIIALFVAFIADLLNNWVPGILGLSFFIGAQALIIIFFFVKKKFEVKELLCLIPLLGISIVYCIAVVPSFDSMLYLIGIPGYVLLITIMVWRAICLYQHKNSLYIILGAFCFFIGDISVIMMLAHGNSMALNIFTWITYTPTLFLLSLIETK